MKDRYRLVLESNILISKECNEGRRVAFCTVRITSCDSTFVDAKSHIDP